MSQDAAFEIDIALVRALLRDQHPALAELPMSRLGTGWDNAVFRLGDAWTVRLPRHAAAHALLENELRWLPELAPRLPLPVPVPLHLGRPACGYPWSWCVNGWLPGEMAALTPPVDHAHTVQSLAAFLSALHQPAPREAPHNPYRSIPLGARDERVREQLARVKTELSDVDHAQLEALWRQLSTVDPWSADPRWLHGDLHPANMLVEHGRLCAVIDFGDLCAGDPATDLSVAWALLPEAARAQLRERLGASYDDATWLRARGWALSLGLAAIAGAHANGVTRAMGVRTLRNVLAGP
jgi:aminoglycoside phosphotransferase (APT) family kinase protein